MIYRWILVLHVLGIISWMAGILYLFRLLVYLKERGSDHHEIRELLQLMAWRLYRYITVPAAVVSWLAGLSMIALQPQWLQQGWFHTKFLAVALLTITTWWAGRLVLGRVELPSGRRLRMLNEVPTLLMIVIVAMVILKPF